MSPESNVMSILLDKIIFADLLSVLLQAGYTVVNRNGLFSIVKNNQLLNAPFFTLLKRIAIIKVKEFIEIRNTYQNNY
ncbi:hypothetical protein ACQUW5_13095 [Legionella sp. CNM-1927-20]|uniref:hypothetical protein n=1 Tax=Legionella sp. CNM-1927-20 TaxID=3422221 RepID=UPI00403AB5FD